eukprot:gene20907-25099_t
MQYDSSKITDEQGKHLRVRYFPFHLNRQLPPVMTASGRKEDLLSSKSRASTVPHVVPKKYPTTHMILDYRQDKKHLVDQAARDIEKDSPLSPSSVPPPRALPPMSPAHRVDFDKLQSNSPKNTVRKLRHTAQPLRSSFVMRRKSSEFGENILFGKAEIGIQTDDRLERLEFPTLTQYQQWSNNVSEPFFKELRKAVKANRPANLEQYIIHYCYAMQKGEPAPILPPSDKEKEHNR